MYVTHIRYISDTQLATDYTNQFIHHLWAATSGVEGSSGGGAHGSAAQQSQGTFRNPQFAL